MRVGRSRAPSEVSRRINQAPTPLISAGTDFLDGQAADVGDHDDSRPVRRLRDPELHEAGPVHAGLRRLRRATPTTHTGFPGG